MDVDQDTLEARDFFCNTKQNCDAFSHLNNIAVSDPKLSKYSKDLFSNTRHRKKHELAEFSRLSFTIFNVVEWLGTRIHIYLILYLYEKSRRDFKRRCPLAENAPREDDDGQETIFNGIPLNIPSYKHIKELNYYIRIDDVENNSCKNSLSREATVEKSDTSDDFATKRKDVEVNVDKVDPIKVKQSKITARNVEDAINSVATGHIDVNQEKTQHLYTVRVASKFKDDHDDDSEEKKEVNLDVVLHQGNFPLQHVQLSVFMQPSSNPNAVFGIPWNVLNREINRILTFARYPKNAVKSALLLAAEGFVYIGSGQGSDDQVKCYFCCGEKRNWGILDVIKEVHRRISPNCSMVTGVNCENYPISATSYLNNSTPLMTAEPAVCTNKQDVSATVVNNRLVLDAHQHNDNAPDRGYFSLPPLSTSPGAVNFSRNINVTSMNGIQTDSALDITQTTPDSRPGEMSTASAVPIACLAKQSVGSAVEDPASYSAAVHHSQTTVEPQNVNRTQQSQPSNRATSNESIQPAEVSRATNLPPTVNHQPSTETQPQSTSAGALTSSANTPPTSVTNNAGANSNASGQLVPNNSGTGDSQRNGNSNGSHTYSELGIITERPKRVEYALTIKRYETFSAWPRDHHLQPTDLAEAGFYYAGYGDCARCFFCGGGLRNWEDEDDVLVEHARWFPKCAYIRQKMGQHFVDAVQELNKQYTQITFSMVTDKMGASSGACLDMKETSLQKDPALTAVKECGYSEKDVLEIALLIKDEGNVLSADAILERLTKEGKRKINPKRNVLESSGSTLEQERELMQRLKEKNNQLRQQTVCKICMDKEVAVVFLPCGHLVSCAECASSMKDCPICRVAVKGIVRAFIS